MKSKLLFPIVALVVVSLACSTNNIPFVATSTPAVFATAAPATATVPVPTNAPTPIPAYTEEFDLMSADWAEPLVVTTQAQPGHMFSAVVWDDGWLEFNLQEPETYIYQFYQRPTNPDVVLETKIQAGLQPFNGMALVCRANTEYTKWYEFRIGSQNDYAIYVFDASRRDKGKNPYIELEKGVTTAIDPPRENVFKAICNGTTLSIWVNDIEVTSIQDNTITDGGLIAIGAMSYSLPPVQVKFDYLTISRP